MESAIKEVLLKIEKNSAKGDIYISRSEENEAAADEGEIERIKSAVSAGAGIRVFKGGRMGFSYTTDLTGEGLAKAASAALDSAFIEGYEGYFPAGFSQPASVMTEGGGHDKITNETRKNTVLEFEAAVKKSEKSVRHVRDAVFKDVITSVYFADTSGGAYKYKKTFYSVMASAVASEGENTEVADVYSQSCSFDALNTAETAAAAGCRAAALLGGGPVATGRYNLIFPDYTGCDIAWLLSRIFHAGNIAKGKSLLSNLVIGDKTASKEFSLRDDALLGLHAGSFPFDAEGTPGANKVLIDRGTYSGFISDRIYAASLGAAPSGNSLRQDFKSMPEPGPSNFYIAGSRENPEEFLKNASGLYVNSLMGLHTADPVSGNFSLGINGWILEKGNRVKSVKECLITGNIKDILERTIKTCGEPVFYGGTGAPVIYTEGIMLAGT